MKHIDSTLTLMRATGNFVYRRIDKTNRKGRSSYKDCMKRCIELATVYGLDTAEFYISEYASAHNFLYPKRLFNARDEEIKYHRLACTNAIEVIKSIRSRFIEGGSSNPKTEGGFYYENESIF